MIEGLKCLREHISNDKKRRLFGTSGVDKDTLDLIHLWMPAVVHVTNGEIYVVIEYEMKDGKWCAIKYEHRISMPKKEVNKPRKFEGYIKVGGTLRPGYIVEQDNDRLKINYLLFEDRWRDCWGTNWVDKKEFYPMEEK